MKPAPAITLKENNYPSQSEKVKLSPGCNNNNNAQQFQQSCSRRKVKQEK